MYIHMYHRACVSCFRRALPAEVQVSGDRQVPRLRSECHGGAVAQMVPSEGGALLGILVPRSSRFFQQKKRGFRDVFLFPGLETIHFYLFW